MYDWWSHATSGIDQTFRLKGGVDGSPYLIAFMAYVRAGVEGAHFGSEASTRLSEKESRKMISGVP